MFTCGSNDQIFPGVALFCVRRKENKISGAQIGIEPETSSYQGLRSLPELLGLHVKTNGSDTNSPRDIPLGG